MYLVIIRGKYLFCCDDPREHGFGGKALEVSFHENPKALDWPNGNGAPNPCIGRIGDDEYREFRSEDQLRSCGYEFVTADYGILQADYLECLQ